METEIVLHISKTNSELSKRKRRDVEEGVSVVAGINTHISYVLHM